VLRLVITPLVAAAVSAALPSGSAQAEATYTALTEFDACLPLADGRVVAGSSGGVVIVGRDGKEARRFTALDGLPGTKIHAVEGSAAGLWVGTDRGVARVDFRGTSPAIRYTQETMAVRDILIDGDSAWVATWGQGILRVGSGDVQQVYKGTTPRANRITSLAKHDGELWWTTAGAGLWHKRGSGPAVQSAAESPGAVLWSLHSVGEALWIGGEGGAHTLGGHEHRSRAVRSLATIEGQVWGASFGEGLQDLESKKNSSSIAAKFARSLNSGFGVSCLGTQDALWVRRNNAWTRSELRAGLAANDVAAFVTDGNNSYVGFFDAGVARIENGVVHPMGIEMDPHVNALAIDVKSGALWIGTSSGLVRFAHKKVTRFTRTSNLPSNHVMSLFPLADGGVLVGTASGAAVAQHGEVHPLGGKGGIVTGNVWAVAQGEDGTQWLGTSRGVFRVRGTKIDRYRVASGELPDDWVMALALADDGVFVGTYNAGVVRLVTTGEEVVAKPLGPGWINPSGLHWDGETLRAATMHGAWRGDGVSANWQKSSAALGHDTTVFVPGANATEWIVTRRGVERRNYRSVSK